MDIPAVMRFFGRDATQQSIVVDDPDQPAGVDIGGQGGTETREEESQKAHCQAEEKELRSASEVEVGRRKHTVH